jgi:hypothetical protein
MLVRIHLAPDLASDSVLAGAALQEAVLVSRAVHHRAAAGRTLTGQQALCQAQHRHYVAHSVLPLGMFASRKTNRANRS